MHCQKARKAYIWQATASVLGSRIELTPEKAIEIQESLGSDIAMVLDECIPYPSTREYVKQSTDRTIRWAQRSLEARRDKRHAVFAIVQGGTYKDLREECTRDLLRFPFDGFAVGGLGVGEGEALLGEMSAFTAALLPNDRPRYLMGLGKPQDLILGVQSGYDLFDFSLDFDLIVHCMVIDNGFREIR